LKIIFSDAFFKMMTQDPTPKNDEGISLSSWATVFKILMYFQNVMINFMLYLSLHFTAQGYMFFMINAAPIAVPATRYGNAIFVK